MTTLLGHSIRSGMVLLCIAEALTGFAAVYVFLALWPIDASSLDAGDAMAFAAFLFLLFVFVSGVGGLYDPESWPRAGRILAGSVVAVLLLGLLAWLALKALAPLRPGYPQWGNLLELLLAFVAAVFLTRLGLAAASQGGLFRRRIAVVRGPGKMPAADEDAAGGDAQGDGSPLHPSFETALVVPAGDEMARALAPERLRARRVWAVVAADPACVPESVRRRCEEAGIPVFGEWEFRERSLNRIDCAHLPVDWLATARGANESRFEASIRRGVDVAGAVALLLTTLPVLALTAIAVKLDSPGPVLYRQERVGRGGRVFTLLKFRSMRVDAEAGGAQWASERDPRVTRVGRFIRLVRVDEVPQLLNVLRGDMALVGPRPERPAFVSQLGEIIPHYHDRALVKPGITGWAQVNYPYGASVEDARMKLAYDLYYVRRRSLFLDFLILVATVRVVLFQEGAR